MSTINTKEPAAVTLLKQIAGDAYTLWIDGLDNKYSPEELEQKKLEVQDRLYKSSNDTKDAIAYGILAAGAAVNVIPVIGQVIGAVLAALGTIVKAVPMARSAPGPNFTWREISKEATYRGFTRLYINVTECKSTTEGKEQGYVIGGPGTPEFCNIGQRGGTELKSKHIAKVNKALLNYGKYFNIPNILNYFPEGPAAKNPSWVGDKSPALYLIEVLDSLPDYDKASFEQRKAVVDSILQQSKAKKPKDKTFKLWIYGAIILGLFIFKGRSRND